MSTAEETERRLTDIEIKLGFTEELVERLNALVWRQQERIDLLLREVAALRAQQAGAERPFTSLRDEVPPHW